MTITEVWCGDRVARIRSYHNATGEWFAVELRTDVDGDMVLVRRVETVNELEARRTLKAMLAQQAGDVSAGDDP